MLAGDRLECLKAVLDRQPSWSDIPAVLLTRSGLDSPVAALVMQSLRNVLVLTRPVGMTVLLSAVRTALCARERQYEVRDQIESLARARKSCTKPKKPQMPPTTRKASFWLTSAMSFGPP